MKPFTRIHGSQGKAARVAGAAYLLAPMTGVLAEVHVRDGLIAGNDAAQTAENILEHKMPFRLGIAANLTNFGPDVLSITARYVELCPRALN